jgi:hypothetical protein
MTGIRSWTWATASFALVVSIAKFTGFFSAVSNSAYWPRSQGAH